jgi:hypothetical protein
MSSRAIATRIVPAFIEIIGRAGRIKATAMVQVTAGRDTRRDAV